MPINRYLLKQEGRAALRDARPNALFMTLMYILLTDGISLVVSLFVDDPLYEIQSLIQAGLDPWRSVLIALAGAGMVGLFVYILLSLYRFVMSFSYRRWALRVARREECAMSDLVAGFGMPGRSVLLGILTTLLYVMWYLIIFLPVLLLTFVFMLLFSVVGLVFVIPLMVAGLVLYFLKISQYSMADFCLADAPQDGVLAAIRRSRAMMAGSCGSYLLLMLSFLGWYLLAALISSAPRGRRRGRWRGTCPPS